jgi:hypothetical protein
MLINLMKKNRWEIRTKLKLLFSRIEPSPKNRKKQKVQLCIKDKYNKKFQLAVWRQNT